MPANAYVILEAVTVLGLVGFMMSLFVHMLDKKTDLEHFKSTKVRLGKGRTWLSPIR